VRNNAPLSLASALNDTNSEDHDRQPFGDPEMVEKTAGDRRPENDTGRKITTSERVVAIHSQT